MVVNYNNLTNYSAAATLLFPSLSGMYSMVGLERE